MSVDPLTEEVAKVIGQHLAEIKKLYKYPVKITIVIRNPGLFDADLVMSNDNTEDAIAAMRHLKKKGIKEQL